MNGNTYDGPIRVGQLRPSQLVHSYGVGGLVDLPHISVIVEGLNHWEEHKTTEVLEERLLFLVRQRKGLRSVTSLRRPPWQPETRNPFDDWARTGVPVSPFPRWLRCPWRTCRYLGHLDDGQFERTDNPYRPDLAAYIHTNCAKKGKGATALPMRFLLACEHGHLDDFPWIDYVHKRQSCASPLLEVSERGQSSGPADVFIKCRSCGKTRTMREAFGEAAVNHLPKCRGRHPHLGTYESGGCDAPVRTLLLGASNGWFPVQLSVLSIPPTADPLPILIEELWPALEEITDRGIFDFAIRRDETLSRLRNYPDDNVWAAMENYRVGDGASIKADTPNFDVHEPEWRQLTNPAEAPDTSDFRIEAEGAPNGFEDSIHDVVRAERLREVVAFTGFTRLSAPDDSEDAVLAPLSRYPPKWVPTIEVRGEGVFIRLNENSLKKWEGSYQATVNYEQLFDAHKNWRKRRNFDDPAQGWPGARYILIHTLSHILMREFALDCGYSASSIRERIYSSSKGDPMAGVLLYTAAPDSEGTLGGLVRLGESKRLGQLLTQAIERAEICTSDPTCAEHSPGSLGDDHVHGAACHACLFVSETSCERGNRYLDRATIAHTVSGTAKPFFT